MKKSAALLFVLVFGLVGCSSHIKVDKYANSAQNTGELSEFSLDNPLNNAIVDSVSQFSWSACTNAEKYTLEICSSDQFISNVETIDYYKRDNIVDTSFKFNANFEYRDVNYYWRVTAKNSKETKVCSQVFTFYVKAPEVEEFHFDLGESDDWQLHELGSYADIVVDNSNFFGDNEKTLKVSFKEEDTNRGNEDTDGWVVVSRTIEKSIYGTDALYFNSFYAGDDARIVIRLVDRDNEYWFCPVQVSNNAKQSVILKFSEFEQRTKDVPVANRVFDFERIKYLEIVFEESFGDGVYLLSNMKAIKFSNYKDLFIEKLDFSIFDNTKYVKDNYEFDYEIHDKTELEVKYFGTNDQGKPKINGYGFLKINVNRYMYAGDAIKITVKYKGNPGSNIVLRVYEEDTDRWAFKIPFSTLTADEYSTLVIPYQAFARSETLGDGRRQFYFILNLQFGLEGQYGTGSIFFKDFEITEKALYTTETKRVVGEDGMVENFDNYTYNSDMYYIWQHSINNKDEYMGLNKTQKPGSNNVAAGQFEYKADMEAALYYIPVEVKHNFSSLSIWLKDMSIKSTNDRAISITDYRPDVGIHIRLTTGEDYLYTIKSLPRVWYVYNIPFNEFDITNEDDLPAPKKDITSQTITHIGISFRFIYKDSKGNELKLYANNNPVLLDNFGFTKFTELSSELKEKVVSMNSDNIAVVDNFESYANTTALEEYWIDGRDYDYQKKALSTEVSSQGGSKSLDLQFKTKSESPSYYVLTTLDSSVVCRVFKLDLKCDRPAKVYINFYIKIGGNESQYRATIDPASTEWTEYVIGFKAFKHTNNSDENFGVNQLEFINRISIGMVYSDTTEAEEAHLLVDNLAFDGNFTADDDFSRFDVNPII